MGKFNKILLNIPHSSFNGIFDEKCGWQYNASLINQFIKETDWHTDFLFSDDTNDNVKAFIFDKSRFLVDVERLENDPLEKDGRGILYTNVNGFIRNIKEGFKATLKISRFLHLSSISKHITCDSIIIDCHSFNNELSPDTDICIGFNEDWSKPYDDTINGVVDIFEKAGYKVSVNKPYSNSITPLQDGTKYKSLMIEVNKKLYLTNGIYINVDTSYAPKLKNTIKKVYEYLLN